MSAEIPWSLLQNAAQMRKCISTTLQSITEENCTALSDGDVDNMTFIEMCLDQGSSQEMLPSDPVRDIASAVIFFQSWPVHIVRPSSILLASRYADQIGTALFVLTEKHSVSGDDAIKSKLLKESMVWHKEASSWARGILHAETELRAMKCKELWAVWRFCYHGKPSTHEQKALRKLLPVQAKQLLLEIGDDHPSRCELKHLLKTLQAAEARQRLIRSLSFQRKASLRLLTKYPVKIY